MRRRGRWLVALALGARAASAEQWIERAPLPAPRQEVAVAAFDGRVCVLGGFGALGQIVDTFECWDPDDDSWSPLAPLPVPAHHLAAAVVDGTLYAFGGWTDAFQTPSDALWAYDAGENEWVARAPLPSPRGSPAAAVLDGTLYAIGGFPNESDFAAYDPGSDEWTPLPPMPTPRNHLGAAALGGLVYAVGGRSGAIGPELNTGALEAFDPVLGEWLPSLAPMPTPRSGHAAAVFAGRLFTFGGEGNHEDPHGIFDETEAFDPATGEWTTFEPMPVGRHGIGAAVLSDGIHLPGGADVAGFGASDRHDVFVPEPNGWLAGVAALAALSLASGPSPTRRAASRCG
jgi:N-acetylneuraminic acid mutarotase